VRAIPISRPSSTLGTRSTHAKWQQGSENLDAPRHNLDQESAHTTAESSIEEHNAAKAFFDQHERAHREGSSGEGHPAAEESIEMNGRKIYTWRNLEEMVATMEFNDPFIDPMDVFLSRRQLVEAREVAAGAEARIVAMAHRHEM
jgi:hypothetical protein